MKNLRLGLFLGLAFCLTPTVFAQLISIKSVPVAVGDQFQLFPSRNAGMGGVSIAIPDPLLDPFASPAEAGRLRRGFLFSAPAFYKINDTGNSGRTLPLGAVFTRDNVFGGAAWALQQIINQDNTAPWWGCPVCDIRPFNDIAIPQFQTFERETSNRNMYLAGLLGFRIPESQSSIAFSVIRADLNAMEGVTLLYPRADRINQSGSVTSFRAGLSGNLEHEREYELVGLLHKVDMQHDVTYTDWVWIDDVVGGDFVSSIEENLDRTDTWGIMGKYRQPIKEDWTLGLLLAANWKDHPKIPNYEIMNIPRDPGNSTGFNIGLGVARENRGGIFGLDVIFEPITSNTWADAAEDIQTTSGKTIPAGAKTIENDFTFSNLTVRTGITRKHKNLDVQLGVEARNIYYDLEQQNYVDEFTRDLNENWTEWSVTGGLNLKFSDFNVRYNASFGFGSGRPGLDDRVFWRESALAADALSDILVAPAGEIWLDETVVQSHQISIIVPLDGR